MAGIIHSHHPSLHASALCLPSHTGSPTQRCFHSAASDVWRRRGHGRHLQSPPGQCSAESCFLAARGHTSHQEPHQARCHRHGGRRGAFRSGVWGLGLAPGPRANNSRRKAGGPAALRATSDKSNEEKKEEGSGGTSTTAVATEEKDRDGPGDGGSSHAPGVAPSDAAGPAGSKPEKDGQGGASGGGTGAGAGGKGMQLDQFSMRELLGPEKVDPDDVKLIRDKVFGYTTFWVTGQEPFGDSSEGVLLRGNLRGNREAVFARLQDGLKSVVGSKYDLFMVEEPNAEEPDPRGGPRVSFILFRREVSQGQPTTVWQYIIALLLAAITAGACLELGIACQELPPDVIAYFQDPQPDTVQPPDVEALVPYVQNALPLAYGVFGVQIFHEVGHRVLAAQRRVEMGIPYLIPNISVGSFGAITQFKSVLSDRTTKFDISVAGPLAGGALSLAMFASGLLLTVDPEGQEALVKVPALLLQGSLLFGGACRAVLGYDAVHATTVGIHPLVIAGWCGLTTTAFNLLPVGCLDGGRAMQAAYGKAALSISSITTYLLLGLGVLGGPLSLPWGLYILIVQRNVEKPALNDVNGVGRWRQGLFGAALALVLLSLVPMWPELADELGIGLGSVVL